MKGERAYISIPNLAVYLDCSVRTVERLLRDMKASRRYGPGVFLERPRRVRIKEVIEFCERGTT